MTIDLSTAVVDLSGLPDAILYDPAPGEGEYAQVLRSAQIAGWAWASVDAPGFIVVSRLRIGS